MKIIKIDYKNPDPKIIKKVAEAIQKGGLAIVPGDAVYTLVGDATNIESIRKVQKIKRRERKKAFNLGLYKLSDIAKYGKFSPLIYKIQKTFPNEPFTFVVSRKKGVLPAYLNPDYESLGFRVPFNKVTSTLSKFNRTPVIGTSANLSGLGNTYSIKELMDYFRGVFGRGVRPDIILDAGELPERKPSTVIEISDKEIKIIRDGEIKNDELNNKLEKLFCNNFK
ncbi:threonylcarbamoyl-AMP synthase [Patescibacteria group bacterium]|nr:threonylcarbamoyl-AMP synthase [Patescibacteria group bacterium]